MTHFRVSQPPPRPVILTGTEAAALFRTADQVQAKGQITARRLTRLTDGIRYLLTLSQARHKATGETWTVAHYAAEIPRGHIRRILIDPEGRTWTLCPATDKDHAKAVNSQTKYRAHLWRMTQEGLAK